MTTSLVNGKTVAKLTFLQGSGVQVRPSGNTLIDGNYQLTIDASKVTHGEVQLDGDGDGAAGGNYVFGDTELDTFFRFFADIDGDRDVDLLDYAYFASTYGSRANESAFNGSFDWDGDGDIDLLDYAYFAGRYGLRLDF